MKQRMGGLGAQVFRPPISSRGWACSAVLVVASCLLPCPVPLRAADPRPVHPPPASLLVETIDGIRLCILHAQWVTATDLDGQTAAVHSPQKTLVVSFDLTATSPAVHLDKAKDLVEYVTRVEARNPAGDVIASTSPLSGQARLFDVDPRWPRLNLDFEVLDPSASDTARGRFSQPLEFSGLPIPASPGDSVQVDNTHRTDRGSRVTVERVFRDPAPGSHRMGVIVYVDPDPEIPDLVIAHFDAGSFRLSDDTGTNLTWRSYQAKPGNALDPDDRRPGVDTLFVDTLPSPDASSLTLKLIVRERAASLRDPEAFRHYVFDLSLSDALYGFEEHPAPVLARADTAGVRVDLELLREDSGREDTGREDTGAEACATWTAQLLLKGVPPAPAESWLVEEIAASDGPDHRWPIRIIRQIAGYWKADGFPVGKDEQVVDLALAIPGDVPTGRKLSLQCALQPIRLAHQVAEFPDVPLPDQGGANQPDLEVKLDTGSRLALRSLVFYDPDDPILGLVARSDPTPALPALAAAVQLLPPGEDAAAPLGARIRLSSARDDEEHLLARSDGPTDYAGDLVAKDQPEGAWRTAWLYPPPPSAETITLRIDVSETIPAGPAVSVVFDEVRFGP